MGEAKVFISQNRKARFDYFIQSTIEAGIMLVGSEVISAFAASQFIRGVRSRV